MAWTAPRTWTTGEVVTASIMNTHVRDNFNETAPAKATSAATLFIGNGVNSLRERDLTPATVPASQTTTSTSYTDLTTSGPAVTLDTGTRALIFWGAGQENNGAGNECYMDFAISGATSRSASDATSWHSTSSAANERYQASRIHLITSATAGSNTFTAKYRVSAGTGTFDNREIVVLGL